MWKLVVGMVLLSLSVMIYLIFFYGNLSLSKFQNVLLENNSIVQVCGVEFADGRALLEDFEERYNVKKAGSGHKKMHLMTAVSGAESAILNVAIDDKIKRRIWMFDGNPKDSIKQLHFGFFDSEILSNHIDIHCR